MLDRSKAPQIRPFPTLSIPYPEEEILSNGITMRTLHLGEMPVNRLTLSWEGGMTDVDNPAALTILSLLLNEGVEGCQGADFSEILDFHGAWLKAEPLGHNFYISLYSLNNSFATLLPTFLKLSDRPALPEQEFKVIREKLAATLEMQNRKVANIARNEDRRLTFGESHPLALDQTPDEIRRITIDDVSRCFDRIVAGRCPTVYFTGMTEALMPVTRKQLENLNFSSSSHPLCIQPFDSAAPGVYNVEADDALQSAIVMSIPAIGRSHPDYIDLRLAITALGGYFGSRLMKNIREDKGYTYGISASLLGYREGGVINIRSQADHSYVKPLIEETKAEICRLASTPMDSHELNALKSHSMTSLAAILDSPFSIMDHHLTHYHQLTPEGYFEKQIEAINNLSSERVSEMIKRHVNPDNLIITVAGKASF